MLSRGQVGYGRERAEGRESAGAPLREEVVRELIELRRVPSDRLGLAQPHEGVNVDGRLAHRRLGLGQLASRHLMLALRAHTQARSIGAWGGGEGLAARAAWAWWLGLDRWVASQAWSLGGGRSFERGGARRGEPSCEHPPPRDRSQCRRVRAPAGRRQSPWRGRRLSCASWQRSAPSRSLAGSSRPTQGGGRDRAVGVHHVGVRAREGCSVGAHWGLIGGVFGAHWGRIWGSLGFGSG